MVELLLLLVVNLVHPVYRAIPPNVGQVILAFCMRVVLECWNAGVVAGFFFSLECGPRLYHFFLLGFTPPPGQGVFSLRAHLFFFYSSSGGWGKIKLELTTLPRIFIRVVYRFNSVAYRSCYFVVTL